MIPLDRVRAPSLECTGASARWCPVCGDCTCGPRYEGAGADEERTLDDDGCPLHGASPQHARSVSRSVPSARAASTTSPRAVHSASVTISSGIAGS